MEASAVQTTAEQCHPWLQGRPLEEWLEQYHEEGYVVFPEVLSAATIAQIRVALEPYFQQYGRNNFEGYSTQRIYALLAKAPQLFSDMVSHPLALAFAATDLHDSFLLSTCLAVKLQPGESVQSWHHDDGQIRIPLPHSPYSVSTFWAIDATTDDNGATELIPRSHVWTAAQAKDECRVEDDIYTLEHIKHDPCPHKEGIKITMPAGSVLIAKGTLWHRGGANKSDKDRLIITPQYCTGWARQIENIMAGVPPEIAVTLPQRVRQLIGYSVCSTFMGHIDGRHPDRWLQLNCGSKAD